MGTIIGMDDYVINYGSGDAFCGNELVLHTELFVRISSYIDIHPSPYNNLPLQIVLSIALMV